MKKEQLFKGQASRWKHFDHKNYSAFSSMKKVVTIGVLTCATLSFTNINDITAQNTTSSQLRTYELSEIEVTGTRVPLTEQKSARMVTVLSRADIAKVGVHSVNDLLKYATGVDVRQRGGFGIQTDISVCGGTFDQVTILLNGINISNPQTGHLAADFPISMEDIERIEILEGPSARVFGTSAFTGAINIVTKSDPHSNITTHLSGGSFGLFEGGGSVNYTKNNLSQQLSGNYNRSDGGTENSDFNTHRFFYQGAYNTKDADIHWQGGYSDQKFGANTFYSAAYPNQFEATKRTMLAIKAETKGWLHFAPSIFWNRAYDHFQLIRNTHVSENFHRNDVFGVNMNAYFNWIFGKTSFGAEIRNEGILSTNLGKPLEESRYVNIPGEDSIKYNKRDNRTNIDYFVEHNILLSKITISAGLLINRNTALDDNMHYYPGVDVSWRATDSWKLFASWNKALRMPTFTDMYYKSPTQEGNVGLKPEKTQAVKLGTNYRKEWINVKVNGFYNKGTDMIDWVKYTPDDTYHSTNFKLDNLGAESNVTLYFAPLLGEHSLLETFHIGYTYIYQKRHDDQAIYKSNYALEYLRHKLVASLSHRIYKNLEANWNFRFQKRMGGYEIFNEQHKSTGIIQSYPSFGLVDLKIQWTAPRYRIFAEANNLLNHHYYDFGNIPQPGIWINAGVSYRIDL
ncbi:MAG: TonB-dependent receptor [Parabacteroides sp.]|nr:TonB-dependent receptor [Parabacteroides sp.]